MKKNIIYLLTGFVFSVGLGLGGLLSPQKIKDFLEVLYPATWSPVLLFVLLSASITYSIIYWRQVRCGKSRCADFKKIPQGKIDGQLILGAAIFGVGWGLSGLCPAPAMARIGLAGLDLSTWVFIGLMFVGFHSASLMRKP
ncbi:MAG: DUF6691 family protein [Bdellovibrionota bacterium]